MSRLSVADEEEFTGQFELWQANVRRSMMGRAGQAALRELRDGLLALPTKRLIRDHLSYAGEVCAVGALLAKRRLDKGEEWADVFSALEELGSPYDGSDENDTADVAADEGVPKLVAWQMVWENQEGLSHVTPEVRYEKMLAWVEAQLIEWIE